MKQVLYGFCIVLFGNQVFAQINLNFGNRHPIFLDAINSPADLKLGFHTIAAPMPSIGANYIIPEVCTDATGFPNAIDVASSLCMFKRKLRVGEPLLTFRTDRAWNQKYMHTLNIPVLKGAELRVLNSREFGNNSSIENVTDPNGVFKRRYFDFDFYTGGDGYDVIEANGVYVSLTGTADPVTTNINRNLATRRYTVPEFYWISKNQSQPSFNKPEDGWVAFKSDIPLNGTSYLETRLVGSTSLTSIPNTFSSSGTIWTNYPVLDYSSGKSLNTIQSWHYSDAIVWTSGTSTKPLDHMELFRFNKEYGLSRWERFETPQGCLKTVAFHNANLPASQQVDANTYCSEANIISISQLSRDCDNGANVIIYPFFQKFMRTSCRDWTYNESYDLPQHPYFVPISEQFVSTRNLVLQSDFAEGQLEKWNSMSGAGAGNLTSLRAVEVLRQGFNNFAGAMSCPACLGNSIYQDIDPRANVANQPSKSLQIQTGVRVQGTVGSQVSLVLFLYDLSGNHIMKTSTQILSPRIHTTLQSNSPDVLAFNFPWDFSARPLSRIRYAVYLTTPNFSSGSLVVDDAFLTILPQK
jgi:hypothetical protein